VAASDDESDDADDGKRHPASMPAIVGMLTLLLSLVVSVVPSTPRTAVSVGTFENVGERCVLSAVLFSGLSVELWTLAGSVVCVSILPAPTGARALTIGTPSTTKKMSTGPGVRSLALRESREIESAMVPS